MASEPLTEAHGDLPALWLHDLTGTDQVKHLLKLANDEMIENGKRTLERLNEAAPNLAKCFELKPTASADIPFKLFSDIEPEPGRQQRFDSFIAVSYCWHSDEWSLAESCVELETPKQRRPPISGRMLSSILALRRSMNEGIWMDRFCIDQDDVEEKQRAIYNMDSIFRSARCVVVVFEDVELSPKAAHLVSLLMGTKASISVSGSRALQLIDLETFVETKESISNSDFAAAESLAQRIVESRWSRRAWCYHEYLLSQDHLLLLSGPAESDVDTALGSRVINLIMVELHERGLTDYPLARFGPQVTVFDHKSAATLTAASEVISSPFVLAIEVCRRSCTHIDDTVNIGLNVSTIGLVFTGVVNDEDHARWILACVCLCYGDATVLTVADNTLRLQDGAYTSWLQWPAGYYTGSSMEVSTRPTVTWESGALQLNFDVLRVDLLQLTQRLEQPSLPSIEKAASVVAHFQDTYPTLFCDMTERWESTHFEHDPEDLERSDLVRHFRPTITYLAAGLDNGAQWVMDAFPAEQQHDWPTEAIADAFRLLLPDHDFNESSEQLHVALVTIMCAAFNYNCRRTTHTISLGSSRPRGIIFELHEASHPGTILAIPSPLANTSCGGVARLWLLQKTSFEEGEAWEVVCKAFIFGCGAIEPNGMEVKILRNVPVVLPS